MSERETRSAPLVLKKGDVVYASQKISGAWETMEARVEEFGPKRVRLSSSRGSDTYPRWLWDESKHACFSQDREVTERATRWSNAMSKITKAKAYLYRIDEDTLSMKQLESLADALTNVVGVVERHKEEAQ